MLLFAAVLVAAVAGGWWLLANRPGGGVEAFLSEQKTRDASARAHLPPAEAFRATICAQTPCVAVEAGGLTFVFGAGSGAAEGIRSLGLMHPNIDALLLPELSMLAVEGLPALAAANGRVGRREALKVFGPAGLLTVVDGANLMAAEAGAPRLIAAVEGEDQGVEGRVLFDSGVVTVRGFGGIDRGTGRVFRVDFDGRSMVLAGCLAQPSDIVAAVRGVRTAAGVLMTGSRTLAPDDPTCLDVADAARAAKQANLSATLVAPVTPSLAIPGAADAWRAILAGEGQGSLQLGLPGARIDLAGETARVLPAR